MMAYNADILPLLEDILPPKGGLLVMLNVYLDRGQKRDKDDEILTVASVMYKRTPYKQFRKDWNLFLEPWGAKAFHATDFYSGCEEFKRDTPERQQLHDVDSKRIPAMVGSHAHRILFVSFRPDEFNKEAPPNWAKKFGNNIHSQAVQLALISNGWWRYDRCRHESFAYFMESGDPGGGEIVQTVERMRQDKENGTANVIAVRAFTPMDKGAARGLEAADFVAWHWNKHYMDKVRKGDHENPRKDFEAFVKASGRVEYIFATGEKLKYFFSRVPQEFLDK